MPRSLRLLLVVVVSLSWPARHVMAQPSAAPSVGAPRAVPQPKSVAVLLLADYVPQLPAYQEARLAFERTLLSRAHVRVDLFDETIDPDRFPQAEQQTQLLRLIAQKHRDTRFAAIVATGARSLAAARTLRTMLTHANTTAAATGRDSIPILYGLAEPGRPTSAAVTPRGGAMAGIIAQSPEAETGRSIQRLLPRLRSLAVIVGTEQEATLLGEELKSALGPQVELVPFVGLTPTEVRRRLSTLAAPAAAFYYRVLRDAQGTSWLPVDYLRAIAPETPVPIFASFFAYLGHGIVGGALRDNFAMGTALARLTAEVINGSDPDQFATKFEKITVHRYDWQQLRSFDLAASRLPEGARIVGAPVPIWEDFPVTTTSALVLLLTLSVSVLLLLRSRRRLKQVNTERGVLAQHLLTVQDTERQRIARDLHDDICQELSTIAVELDRRHSEEGNRRRDDKIVGLASQQFRSPLGDRMRDVLKRTRQVALGLHAEPLAYSQLEVVLRREAVRLYERHRIRCDVASTGTSIPLPPDLTSGTYRIVLEAVQNVVKHASATRCTITLTYEAREFRVRIEDDGVGFISKGSEGLGLISMRERALAMGGQLVVQSNPYFGTSVVLTLPLFTPSQAPHQVLT